MYYMRKFRRESSAYWVAQSSASGSELGMGLLHDRSAFSATGMSLRSQSVVKPQNSQLLPTGSLMLWA